MKLLDMDGLKYLWGRVKSACVPITRKVNGKALSEDVNLTSVDVGALPTQSGATGQLLGFTAPDVVGAVDAPSGGVYDVVIRTQAEFEALIASPTWLDAVSVCFVGDGGNLKFTRSDGLGCKMPQTVKQIFGINSATINVTGFVYSPTNNAALWYETIPSTDDFRVDGLTVLCSEASAFENCINISNCNGIVDGSVLAKGFNLCANLTNCTGIGTAENAWGFCSCTRLLNCTGKAIGNSSPSWGYGFDYCEQLTACVGECTNTDLDVWDYRYCRKLESCIGNTSAYWYCKYLSNCDGIFVECDHLANCMRGKSGGPYPDTPTFVKCTHVTADQEYVGEKMLVFAERAVTVSGWSEDQANRAQGYNFRASVACTGVTANHRPDVAFSVADAVSGNFAPVADSYDGGVYIYCKETPTATVTIPSIVCVKGV